jgi:DNA-binding XRE family transcriptional regulator
MCASACGRVNSVSFAIRAIPTASWASKVRAWSNCCLVTPEEILEHRVPTPAEVAEITKALREAKKWTQETLAEVAGLTNRTIQRVENGEPSSLDTRRAIAGAFAARQSR